MVKLVNLLLACIGDIVSIINLAVIEISIPLQSVNFLMLLCESPCMKSIQFDYNATFVSLCL